MNPARASSPGIIPLIAAGMLFMVAGIPAEGVPPGGYTFVPTAKEAEIYRLIREDTQQMRKDLILDPRLCHAARSHAEDTQRRRFFNHVNPDGINANRRALEAAYPLPAHYTPTQNYIESMAGSVVGTPADALANWRSSQPHATHVFGKSAFYREQVVIGVGHAPASGLGYATYVFLSVPLPNGQNGASAVAIALGLESSASGALFLTRAPPESIMEIWTSGPSLASWNLERTVVVDATGRIPVGFRSGPSRFFRGRYLGP